MRDSYVLAMYVNNKNAGLALQFKMLCNNCNYKFHFINSSVHQHDRGDFYDLNVRLI